MALVVAVATFTEVQRVALVDIQPHRRGIPLPNVDRRGSIGVRHIGTAGIVVFDLLEAIGRLVASVVGQGALYRDRVIPRLAHDHHGIRDTLPAHGAIFLDGLVQQAERLGALHSGHRIFPDHHFGVVDKPGGLVGADDLAPEVADANVSIVYFAGG